MSRITQFPSAHVGAEHLAQEPERLGKRSHGALAVGLAPIAGRPSELSPGVVQIQNQLAAARGTKRRICSLAPALEQRANVLCLPNRDTWSKFDVPGIASGLHASPPGRLADRNGAPRCQYRLKAHKSGGRKWKRVCHEVIMAYPKHLVLELSQGKTEFGLAQPNSGGT